jgi:hypothetical protein
VRIQRILCRNRLRCGATACDVGAERVLRGLGRVGRGDAIAGTGSVQQDQTSKWELANIFDEHDTSMGSKLKMTFNFTTNLQDDLPDVNPSQHGFFARWQLVTCSVTDMATG